MKNYRLFLDDCRMPADCCNFMRNKTLYENNDWIIVRSAREFKDLVSKKFTKREFPSFISFDHDLADAHYGIVAPLFTPPNMEQTGMDAARWLVEFCMDNNLKLPDFEVHSQNTVGKENIINLLRNFTKIQNRQEGKTWVNLSK